MSMHEDFSFEMVIPFDEVAGLIPATAENCKEKITNMLVNLGRIIARWERSGTTTMRDGALVASRGEFLRGRPSYLLYLWHHLEENNLVTSAVARNDPRSMERVVCHLFLAAGRRRVTRMTWLLLLKAFVILASTMRWWQGLKPIFPSGIIS
jgi:hypothetical protein